MKFAHRMVKMFCESLTMTGQLEFQDVTLDSIGGVRVSIRKNNIFGQPKGTVVVAATTIWLPLPAQKIFEFLRDPTNRSKVHYLDLLLFTLFCALNIFYL